MPIIKSAIKQMRQSRVKQVRNLKRMRELKEAIKAVTKLVKEKKLQEARDILGTAYKKIDLVTKKNLWHRNKAARKKSQLAKLVAAK